MCISLVASRGRPGNYLRLSLTLLGELGSWFVLACSHEIRPLNFASHKKYRDGCEHQCLHIAR